MSEAAKQPDGSVAGKRMGVPERWLIEYGLCFMEGGNGLGCFIGYGTAEDAATPAWERGQF